MANFQKFIKRSTKGIFLGIIVIMVVSLTISFAPGGGMGGEDDAGDAGIIFDDVTITTKDFQDHRSRTAGHLRFQEFRRRIPSIAQLKQLYQQYYKRDFTERDLAAQVSQSIKLKDSELNEKTWEQIILLQDAVDKGVAVSEEEAGKVQEEFFSQLGADGKNLALQFLGADRYKVGIFFREALIMEKLLDLVSQSQFPSYEDIYDEILTGTEEARVLYTSLDPYDTVDFLDMVGRVHPDWLSQIRNKRVKQSKITDYYKKNEWKFGIPAKIQVFYLLADFEEIQKTLPDPTGEEARKYYEENKESFVKKSEEGSTSKIYKSLKESLPEVTRKWKSREAKIRSNQAMREFEKWMSSQVSESVQVEYLLIDLEGIAATLPDPSTGEKEQYFQTHLKEFEKEGKTPSLDEVEGEVTVRIKKDLARVEADRLSALAEKLIAGFQKNRSSRRRNFMPSVSASIRKEGGSPVESVIKRYYEKHREDFRDESGGPSGEAKYKPLGTVRNEIISRLREGKVVLGYSDELKAVSSADFRKLAEVVGSVDPAPQNWREAVPRSWAFTQGRRVRDVSPVSDTTLGKVFYRLKKKTYGTKIMEDFQAKAKKDFGLTLSTGITSYFDKENTKEVLETVGADVVRGAQSTLSTWGFDPKRGTGDVSRQMETSKGYIVYRLQGAKETYVPKTIIDSVRERIVKVLLKEQMKEKASQLATEISADINLHGLGKTRKKYGIDFKRSKYFKLNGSDSAIDSDASLGREISRQVAEEKSGEELTRAALSIGESRIFDGSKVTGKTDWSFVVYMQDLLDRPVDSVDEKRRFDELRKSKETEIRDQYKKDYVELVVNRANRKDLLDSEDDSE